MGELIKTFVNEGGDTGFMSVLKTDPSQQGSTTEALTDFNEAVNTSTELADSNINVEQAVADSIRENASNPNTAPKVQAALAEGITALTKIESRIKADSGIANHQGIDIEAIHDTYMGFARSEISTEAAAQAMAENIRAVIQTRALTVSERTQLMGVLTEMVGSTELAEAYVGQITAGAEAGIIPNGVDGANVPNMDVEGENGYNEGGDIVGEAVEKQQLADKIAQEYNLKYNPAERAKNKGYEGIGTTANGGVTFEGTKYMYPVGEGQLNRITIQAQGTRTGDFNMANGKAGLDATPGNAVWHHLDDYNVITGEITLELVYKDAHKATVPHAGSCAQYDAVHGPSYNK